VALFELLNLAVLEEELRILFTDNPVLTLYGVSMISRLLKIAGLFCRISSLL